MMSLEKLALGTFLKKLKIGKFARKLRLMYYFIIYVIANAYKTHNDEKSK